MLLDLSATVKRRAERETWRPARRKTSDLAVSAATASSIASTATKSSANASKNVTAAAAVAAAPRLPIRLDALRHSKASEPHLRASPPAIRCSLLAKGNTAAHLAAAKAIAKDGFVVCQADLHPQVVSNARAEAAALYAKDAKAFMPGGFTVIGKTVDAGSSTASRGDAVMWLHDRLKKHGGDFKAVGRM